MKNRKKIMIFSFCLALILIVIAILILNVFSDEYSERNLRGNGIGKVENLELLNFTIEKVGIYYNVSAQLKMTNSFDFDSNNYNIYLLDNSNNLIYVIKGSSLGDFDSVSDSLNINTTIRYEIGSVVRAVIVEKDKGYKFNKDLRKTIKEIDSNNLIYFE